MKKKARDPGCPYCPEVRDDVKHTVFVCPHFEADRSKFTRLLGRSSTQEDEYPILWGIHYENMQNERLREYIVTWENDRRKTFVSMVEEILEEKKEDDRRR